jgi:aromatic ring-opening dioxygenase catalytic subunit (LigB family)
MIRMPVYFLSHGGGPWPYVEGMRQQFAKTEREFRALPERLPAKPKAALVITGHWEADEFTVSSAEYRPMEYDYYLRVFKQFLFLQDLRNGSPGSRQLSINGWVNLYQSVQYFSCHQQYCKYQKE